MQRVHLVAVGTPDDERIEVTVTKGLEGLLGFSEARDESFPPLVARVPAIVTPEMVDHGYPRQIFMDESDRVRAAHGRGGTCPR